MTECPRSREAEAVRDDRLRGAERRSFERHAATCATCRGEMRSLDELAEALKSSAAPEIDQLRKLRGRRRLLRPEAAVESRRPAWILRLAFALLAVVFSVSMLRRPRVANAIPTEFVTIDGTAGARFERTLAGTAETIVLNQGELSVSVHHPTGHEHLVVKLPDGELEDVGTVFSVRVEGGATQRVVVREGAIVLRLRGRAPIRLVAGAAWDRPAPPPLVVSPIVVAPMASVEPSAAPVPVPLVAKNAPAIDTAAADWKAAMSAHRSGEYRVAAAKFAVFVHAHPADAHAEDAAYLRIIALQRASDVAAMRSAAKDYLARHPKGFRRSEVERMVTTE